MPNESNEIVLVLNKNNEISTTVLYELGILPSSEYKEILSNIKKGKELNIDSKKINFDEIIGKKYYLVPSCNYYEKNSNGTFTDIRDDKNKLEKLVKEGIELKISGVIKQKDSSDNSLMSSTVGYIKALEDEIIKISNNSIVVKEQENNKEKNILNGLNFNTSTNEEKAKDTKDYLLNLGISEKASFFKNLMAFSNNSQMINSLSMMSEEQLATSLDRYLNNNPDNESLVSIYNNYLSAGSYEENMKMFGKIDLNSPSSINIYTDTFENKDQILSCIDKYNESATDENKITYTDYIGLLISSVTTIINAISYVLIAFVSISLIVSSIMIAIITYISVLERTKEIGILRAMGTSKKDISKIFNAETFIEGLIGGILGITITLILNILISRIIYKIVEIENIATLPINGAISLIIVSVVLPVIAGLIPAKFAAKRDPAVVLRSE